MKRDWHTAWRKVHEDLYCRLCGLTSVDPHHVLPRSLGGTESTHNIVALCRDCHRAVHRKEVDLLSVLTLEEQSYAVSLIGIERAHRLLAPSLWREKAAA